MTPAAEDRPRTTLDLLFGKGEDAPAALARQILSTAADGNLERGLASLPSAIGEAAVREAATQAAGLLDVDLIGLLVAGWRVHQELTAAARRTLAVPGSTELVDLVTYQITTAEQPSVTVLVDGREAAVLHLGLSVVFELSAMLAGIRAGRMVALHSGRCDITANLAIQGITVLTRQAHLELPGVVPLIPGIRLLGAENYPADAEPAEGAGAGLAPRTAPARAETVQMPLTPRRPDSEAPPTWAAATPVGMPLQPDSR